MARSNYSFQKRQKELARKKKKEEKRQARLNKKAKPPEDSLDASQAEDDPGMSPLEGEEQQE